LLSHVWAVVHDKSRYQIISKHTNGCCMFWTCSTCWILFRSMELNFQN